MFVGRPADPRDIGSVDRSRPMRTDLEPDSGQFLGAIHQRPTAGFDNEPVRLAENGGNCVPRHPGELPAKTRETDGHPVLFGRSR